MSIEPAVFSNLAPAAIPGPDAGDDEINNFALSFNGYDYWGSMAACAAAADERRHETIAELRSRLFFEQRRAHWTDTDTSRVMRRLVAMIRAKAALGETKTPTFSRDEKLKALYDAEWDNLAAAIPTDVGMSGPLLVKVPASYEECEIKLAVVGQETHGWAPWDGGHDRAQIDALRQQYEDFERGKHRKKISPFFEAAYILQDGLNPGGDRYGFAWLNLFCSDQEQRQPAVTLHDQLRDASLLADEIAILEPEAVVFFTGPNYDYTIKRLFLDAELIDLLPGVRIFRAEGLPAATLRTYHPGYLRRTRRFGYFQRDCFLAQGQSEFLSVAA
ncbi:MAG: hypothetical protein ABIR71_06030 [Chthoniobacterales bacterium]